MTSTSLAAPPSANKCAYCPKVFDTPRGKLTHLGMSTLCMAAHRSSGIAAEKRAKAPKVAPPDPMRAVFETQRRDMVSDACASLRGDESNLGDAQMSRIKSKLAPILMCAEKELVRRFEAAAKSTTTPDMKAIVHEVLDVFNGLETSEREFAYLVNKVPYIEPVQHVFGKSMAHTTDAEGFTYSKKEVVHRGYYMPMTGVIERLLQADPHALEMVLRTQHEWFAKPPKRGASKKIYVDVPDGLLFDEHPELGRSQRGKAQNGRIKLCLIMYYDGLEVCNPLGFARGKHQLGVFLYSIVNLDPTVRTTPGYIQIAGIVLESDVKKFGPLVVFSGISKETGLPDPKLWATPGAQLRKFDEGVRMALPLTPTTATPTPNPTPNPTPTPTAVHGWMVLFIGDMLAVHKLLCFVETPSAYCPCRECDWDTRKPKAYQPVHFLRDGQACRWTPYTTEFVEQELTRLKKLSKSAAAQPMQDMGLNSLECALSPKWNPHFRYAEGTPQVRCAPAVPSHAPPSPSPAPTCLRCAPSPSPPLPSPPLQPPPLPHVHACGVLL